MPTYISLLKFTQQGISRIKDSPNRLDSAKRSFQSAGAMIKDYYLTMGQYDAVVVIDAPDDETMARLILAAGSDGNVSTETVRAFTEEEYRKLIADLP